MKISKDPTLLQFDIIHKFLSTCYWAEGLSVVRMKRAIENSLNIGAYINGEQIAYARIVTDSATYAYLCDVFVVEAHRGKGISKEMMKFIMNLPELHGIKRFALVTLDAQGLYQQFGFKNMDKPEMYMEVNRSGIYKLLQE